jgi:hypothetical protein
LTPLLPAEEEKQSSTASASMRKDLEDDKAKADAEIPAQPPPTLTPALPAEEEKQSSTQGNKSRKTNRRNCAT